MRMARRRRRRIGGSRCAMCQRLAAELWHCCDRGVASPTSSSRRSHPLPLYIAPLFSLTLTLVFIIALALALAPVLVLGCGATSTLRVARIPPPPPPPPTVLPILQSHPTGWINLHTCLSSLCLLGRRVSSRIRCVSYARVSAAYLCTYGNGHATPHTCTYTM